MTGIRKFCYDYFKLNDHRTRIRQEFLAGLTNYLTIIYAVLLVPEILIEAFPGAIDKYGNLVGDNVVLGNMTAAQVLVALTAVSFFAAGVSSIFTGMFVNLPFVQGPSFAIATFVTYTICKGFGYSYTGALAIVFISGIVFLLLAITGFEERLHNAIPNNIKYAVAAGIGLFIAYTGLKKAHIIDNGTFFNMLNLADKNTRSALLAGFGVILIVILIKKHIHGAIFIGKLICVALAMPLGLIKMVDTESLNYSIGATKLIFKMDFSELIDVGSTSGFAHSIITLMIIVFAITLMNIFETVTVSIAMDHYVELEHNMPKRALPRMLEVDAITTSTGAMLGITNVSTYAESTTGVIEGGRTGLTAVFTGIMFLVSMLFTPVMSIMPSAATATTLIVAGVMLLKVIKLIDFEDMAEAIPAFLTMFLMPLTNSLFIGLSVGFISYVIIHIFIKHDKSISPLLYLMAALCLVALIFVTAW
jgi:AGZA family xanthine/uracil permease-like MFS transporter